MGIKQIKIRHETGETLVIERSSIGLNIYNEGHQSPPIRLTWEEVQLLLIYIKTLQGEEHALK